MAVTDPSLRLKRKQKDLKLLPNQLDVVVEPRRLNRKKNPRLRDLRLLKMATVAVGSVEVEVVVEEDRTETAMIKLKAATREKKETVLSVLKRLRTPTLGFQNSITRLNARNTT